MPSSGRLDLWGTAEIAAHLGVSRQRVQQLSVRPGFPEPAAVLALGKVWHAADVRGWSAERGRSV